MAGQFEGKVALVTGAGSGIGRATALAFAREGARVVIGNRRTDAGTATVDLIRKAGGEAAFRPTDISRSEDVAALVQFAVEHFGRLDYACNNAGNAVGGGTPAHEYTEADWNAVIATNLTGTWLCLKYQIREMLRLGGGAIVNVSSIGGITASTIAGVAYGASKHGIIGLTKTAAIEYAKSGIRINAICPGYIITEIYEDFFRKDPELEGTLAAREPIGRLGSVEEAAQSVLWLCSPASSFVTGVALPVDGGYTATAARFA